MGVSRVVITDFTDDDHSIERDIFDRSGVPIEIVTAAESRALGLEKATSGAAALLVQFAPIDRQLIGSLEACRVISRYGIGVDMVDLAAAGEAGIPVTNVPDFCIDEVSTQTVGFLIDLNRSTLPLNEHVHSGRWGTPPAVPAPRRLKGQSLGIVGLGTIGREVARKSAALGLTVSAYDPYTTPDAGVPVTMVPLDELLAGSDYVSLHCPLNDSTRGLIGAAELTRMKDSAYLLNLSRGAVVDEAALQQALAAGRIAGAALDVLATEPPDADNPLLRMANVIITPHTASWSAESAEQLRRDAARNVIDGMLGRELRSVVNRNLLDTRQAAARLHRPEGPVSDRLAP